VFILNDSGSSVLVVGSEAAYNKTKDYVGKVSIGRKMLLKV
jgi:hypothetical protein